MPQEIKTIVYTLAELEALGNDKAVNKAFEWLQEANFSHEWWEHLCHDAKFVGADIASFDVYRRNISFRLEHDAPSVALAIKRNHGEACGTYRLACDFLSVYDDYHGVNGKITLLQRELDEAGERREYIEGDVFDDIAALEEEYAEKAADFARALGEEYLCLLVQEHELISSKEYLRDMAEANEYTFTAEGKRFG